MAPWPRRPSASSKMAVASSTTTRLWMVALSLSGL